MCMGGGNNAAEQAEQQQQQQQAAINSNVSAINTRSPDGRDSTISTSAP